MGGSNKVLKDVRSVINNQQQPRESRVNILSTDSLSLIESAFQNSIVFGVLDRRGHMSPYQWAFLSFSEFQSYLSTCGPGDTFEAWSINELLKKKLLLAHAKDSVKPVPSSILLSTDDLATIRSYLDTQYNEFIAVYVAWESKTSECSWGDVDSYDELVEYIIRYSSPNCEVYVFPLTAIDKPEHYLMKARYPYPHEINKSDF